LLAIDIFGLLIRGAKIGNLYFGRRLYGIGNSLFQIMSYFLSKNKLGANENKGSHISCPGLFWCKIPGLAPLQK
tara:strand:- start:65632 stop:65853 length:222 start_codon:yes stop_codon:yes gene_type:complete